ncbi:hypothetical protein [Maritalea sp.]|uniref:hypothetical protein n=1 Tax=Maritalea sp. TaxID=2003361 RepID=UPI003EF4B280
MSEMSAEQIEELKKRRRKRSIALGIVLGALAILFYAVTIVKIGPAIFQRPL